MKTQKEMRLYNASHYDVYNELIAKNIQSFFKDYIFKGLFDIIINNKVKNSQKKTIIDYIQDNKIFYNQDGSISGSLNMLLKKELRKLGATYKKGKYYLPMNAMPDNIKTAFIEARQRRIEVNAKIADYLNNQASNLAIATTQLIPVQKIYANLVESINKDIDLQITKLGFEPDYQANLLQVAKDLTDSLHLSIKEFTEKELLAFRQDIQKSLQTGTRINNLSDYIKEKYQFAQNRASFIAKQETRIFLSNRQQSRFTEANIDEFKWAQLDSNNPNRREQHHIWSQQSKQGKTFKFSSPPINPETGKPELPGEPFNCKCVAIAVVK